MRLYRIYMRSGAKVDVVAQTMIDDPESTDILFYQDEGGHHLAAAIHREEVAGLVLGPQYSSAVKAPH